MLGDMSRLTYISLFYFKEGKSMDQKINIHIYSYEDGTVSVDVSVPANVKVNRVSHCHMADPGYEDDNKTNVDEEDEGLLYDDIY